MRDPDLVVSAQQAATALERAWNRWRKMHGLPTDPPPAVSSYVGYSLEAPWGQPRIVFGISGEDAEVLAKLLDKHDCVGPVHASVQASPGAADPEPDAPAMTGLAAETGPAGLLHVPAPAPASAGQQPLPAASMPSRQGPVPARLTRDSAAASALTSPDVPGGSGIGTPIALAAASAVEASAASRREAASVALPAHAGPAHAAPDQPQEPATEARPGETLPGAHAAYQGEETALLSSQAGDQAVAPEIVAFRPAHRGGSLSRLKLPAQDRGDEQAEAADEDRPRAESVAAASDAAAWTASEVPGQTAVTDTAV
jgi:hypothetical protein